MYCKRSDISKMYTKVKLTIINNYLECFTRNKKTSYLWWLSNSILILQLIMDCSYKFSFEKELWIWSGIGIGIVTSGIGIGIGIAIMKRPRNWNWNRNYENGKHFTIHFSNVELYSYHFISNINFPSFELFRGKLHILSLKMVKTLNMNYSFAQIVHRETQHAFIDQLGPWNRSYSVACIVHRETYSKYC